MALISLEPEFIVDPSGTIHTGVLVVEGNRIKEIAKAPPEESTRIRLLNKMLLPGFINVHSHALQRALRGRVEQKSPKGLDDFWSWRTQMYHDASKASLEDIEAIATLAYWEMLKSGFVAVGEFNYLHHQPTGEPYDRAAAISQRLMKAAERVGIRQVLLTCAYERKNHREKLIPEQKRFAFHNADEFLQFAKEVRESVQSPLLTHGLAMHSTRACTGTTIEKISRSNLASQGPLHIHACEQAQEVREALEEYGHSPIGALHNFGALAKNTTLIHATHLTVSDIETISKSEAMVGLCPSTERNLGDGLCPISDLFESGITLAIGTDQHVRLDPVEELRAIEEQERLRLQKRCIIAQAGRSIAETLISIGTMNGRRSLGLEFSANWAGGPADLVAIQLPTFYEVAGPLSALNSWLVSGNHSDVKDVFVNGKHVVSYAAPFHATKEILGNANDALKNLTSSL